MTARRRNETSEGLARRPLRCADTPASAGPRSDAAERLGLLAKAIGTDCFRDVIDLAAGLPPRRLRLALDVFPGGPTVGELAEFADLLEEQARLCRAHAVAQLLPAFVPGGNGGRGRGARQGRRAGRLAGGIAAQSKIVG